jgi:hypothetical protein
MGRNSTILAQDITDQSPPYNGPPDRPEKDQIGLTPEYLERWMRLGAWGVANEGLERDPVAVATWRAALPALAEVVGDREGYEAGHMINAIVGEHPLPPGLSFFDAIEAITDETLRTLMPRMGQRASDIRDETLLWTWPGYIPRKLPSIVIGDTAEGKTTLLIDWFARITRGRPWPDDAPCEEGNVILYSCEDGASTILKPRFREAGADLDKVTIVNAVDLRKKHDGTSELKMISLPDDLGEIEEEIRRQRVVAVAFDPFEGFLNRKFKTKEVQDVRHVLAQVAAMADRCNCAVIFLTHPIKNAEAKALHKIGGSIAFAACARAAWAVGTMPDETDRMRTDRLHAMVAVKPVSVGATGAGRTFRTISRVPEDRDVMAHIEYCGTTDTTADQLFANPAAARQRPRGRLVDAKDFLLDELGDRQWHLATEVEAKMTAARIATQTLRDARDELKAKGKLEIGREKKKGGRSQWRLV